MKSSAWCSKFLGFSDFMKQVIIVHVVRKIDEIKLKSVLKTSYRETI